MHGAGIRLSRHGLTFNMKITDRDKMQILLLRLFKHASHHSALNPCCDIPSVLGMQLNTETLAQSVDRGT